jgi:hypothetical protein
VRPMTAGNRQDDAGTQAAPPRRRRVFPPSRRSLIGVVAAGALVAAGGISACGAPGSGHIAGAAADAGVSFQATAGAGTDKVAAAGLPQTAATPRIAVMPKPRSRASHTAHASTSPSASRSASTSPSAAASASQAPTSGGNPTASPSSPASAPPVSAGSANCTNPSFSSSAQYGIWNQSPYYVYNNMWGISGYSVSQTISACSYSNWYVTATMNNNNGDGHVKTYPNSQRDFNNTAISSLNSVTSTFAETSPGTGIYEDAYDIWLNGLATSGSTEVMIWTQNNGQTPSGSVQGTVTVDGRTFTVWKSGSYIAFVANSNFTSGTVNLLAFFQYIIGKGWIPGSSTLSQVCYGVELVSTNGAPATFTFSNYSVNAS